MGIFCGRLSKSVVGAFVLLVFASSCMAQAADVSNYEWQEQGEQVYRSNCSSCHQASGQGIPGVFPPLAGHLSEIYALEGGENYLVHVVLHGLQGGIEVNGQHYDGSMPQWKQLADDDLSAVLNHILTAWDDPAVAPDELQPVLPQMVTEARSEEMTSEQVLDLRVQLFGEEPTGSSEPAEQDSEADAGSPRDGWYTTAQAERGEVAYAENCASCHGDTLRGTLHSPRLTELGFFRTWNGRTLDVFYDYTASQMPLDSPGSLTDSTYVDILAFWLSFHDYPAGDLELENDRDLLRQITIEM